MNSIENIIGKTDPPRNERCEDHGEFVSRNIIFNVWSRCPVCESEREAAAAIVAEERARVEKQQRWLAAIGRSGIPERFMDRSLDSFVATTPEQTAALAFATEYAASFAESAKSGRSAIFVGKPGTGKTHLAAGIGMSVMKSGYSALFTTVIRAVRRVKDTWGSGGDETESEAVAALVRPDLLILDEVGVQFGSDTEKMILFDVLNERYECRKPCIMLSNLQVSEVADYLGERIIDRVREDGGKVIRFVWDSHRRAQ